MNSGLPNRGLPNKGTLCSASSYPEKIAFILESLRITR